MKTNGVSGKNATYGSWQDNAVDFFFFVYVKCLVRHVRIANVDGQD